MEDVTTPANRRLPASSCLASRGGAGRPTCGDEEADDGIPQTVAPVEEIQLYVRDAAGNRANVTFQELVDRTLGQPVPRADLHIGRSNDGELFITSRQDGTVRMLVP